MEEKEEVNAKGVRAKSSGMNFVPILNPRGRPGGRLWRRRSTEGRVRELLRSGELGKHLPCNTHRPMGIWWAWGSPGLSKENRENNWGIQRVCGLCHSVSISTLVIRNLLLLVLDIERPWGFVCVCVCGHRVFAGCCWLFLYWEAHWKMILLQSG